MIIKIIGNLGDYHEFYEYLLLQIHREMEEVFKKNLNLVS